jgi:hypothetical protein
MRYAKLSIALNALCLALWIGLTAIFLTMNTIAGYMMSAAFFAISCYGGYYFYRTLWLHNGGHPLSEEKKRKREQIRKQMRNYQRYNLYHRLYLFADATEEEYQAEKVNQSLKLIRKK